MAGVVGTVVERSADDGVVGLVVVELAVVGLVAEIDVITGGGAVVEFGAGVAPGPHATATKPAPMMGVRRCRFILSVPSLRTGERSGHRSA